MDRHDGTENLGRKGVAYDSQSLHVAAQTRDLDGELVPPPPPPPSAA